MQTVLHHAELFHFRRMTVIDIPADNFTEKCDRATRHWPHHISRLNL
jgi:hypothetical protein